MGNTQSNHEYGPGFALIIHNDEFDPTSGLSPRPGNSVDVTSVKNTLKILGFESKEVSNFTATAIIDTIKTVCTDAKYSKYSCLVVVVMTHGAYGGKLYAYDTHYNTSDIWTPLTTSQNFANKPKLLFFQACRGDESEGMIITNNTAEVQNISSSCRTFEPNKNENEEQQVVDKRMPLLPHDQHFFLSFSTVEDKKSIRNIDAGSWYIQTLCNIVNSSTTETKNDLISLMTKVTYDIIYREEGYIAQTPSYISFLPYTVTFTLHNNATKVQEEALSSNSVVINNLSEDSSGTARILSTNIEFDGKGSKNVKFHPSHFDWRRTNAGKCLVFNDDMHVTAAQKMRNLFCDMNYDIEVIRISSNNIATKLQEVAENFSKLKNDETPDSLIVVILAKLIAPKEKSQVLLRHEDSHVASDTCISDTWSIFIASQCEALLSRPKIFFYLDNRNVKDSDAPEISSVKLSPRVNDHQDFFFVYGYGKEFINCLVESLRDGYQKLEVHSIVTKAIHDARQILESKVSSSAILNTGKLPYIKSTLSLQLIFGNTRNIDEENSKARQIFTPEAETSTSNDNIKLTGSIQDITKTVPANIDAYGNNLLHSAVYYGDLATVHKLISLGFDVNVKNSYGQSAIYLAVQKNRLDIVKCLVEYCEADVNITLNDGETLLQSACLHGTIDVVRYLIEKGANVNGIRRDGDTALQVASAYGKIDIVKLLVENGANVRHAKFSNNTTALHVASLCIAEGTYECVKYLIEKGAEVNAKEHSGFTPLFYAVMRKNSVEKIQLLIDNGANDISFAFKIAVDYINDLSILECLLNNGADINITRPDGKTALHIAAQFGNVEYIKWLLEKGCDIHKNMTDGTTPLQLASNCGHFGCVKLLIENGANPY